MLQFLPVTLLALFGGVVADRSPKRRVLLATQSLAAFQALILAALVYTHTVRIWHVYLLALLLGLVNAIDNPVRQAFVVELVGRERLPNAVALNSTLFNAARIVGPALGGLAIGVFGIGGAFAINAASFLATLGGLALMHPSEFRAVPHPARGRVLPQLFEGLRYAFGTSEVLLIVILMGCIGLFGYNFTVVLPLLAKYTLAAGPVGLGMLTSAMGAGSVVSALALAYSGRPSRARLFGGAALFSVSLLLVGMSDAFPLTLALLFVLGCASVAFSSTANTRLQLTVPDELRGRVMSLYFLLFAGTTPLGGLLVGVLASHLGVRPTVGLMAGACLAGTCAAAVYAHRRRPHEGERVAEPARAAGAGG
jgi:MFS family permease